MSSTTRHYLVRRLADASAFVVFDTLNWQTSVILQTHVDKYLETADDTDNAEQLDHFPALSPTKQNQIVIACLESEFS